MEILFVIGIVVLVILIAVLSAMAERKRRAAFLALSMQLGLDCRFDDHSIDNRYPFLDDLEKGDNRYASITLFGTYKDYTVELFEYHYETHTTDSKGRRQTQHHYSHHAVLDGGHHESEEHQAKVWFPELRIYPENFLSRIGQAFGYQDIDFESIEFSRSFTVRSKDKKFAYDVCNGAMMEHLLKHKNYRIEVEGRNIALSFQNKLNVTEVESNLNAVIQLRKLFPEYLYKT